MAIGPAALDESNSDVLEVQGITKVFAGQSGKNEAEDDVVALYDVSFRVKKNEFVCLLGPSGCGKTTLIRIIAGILTADTGRILVNGVAVKGPGKDRPMVFQNYGLLPWRTVMGNVELGLELEGVEKGERRRIAQKYIELVGLAGFESHYPHQISGGMQQRAGLARALSKQPEMLLLDEPFASVDAQTREILQEELLRIWGQTKMTAVFVTHSIDEAVYLSDRVFIMTPRPGQIQEVLDVDLPRPRWQFDVKSDPRFVKMTAHIRETLRK